MHRRRKPPREKRKKRILKNKLTYGTIAVAIILVCLFAYSSLHSTSKPKAAIIDHLGFSSPPPNKAFNDQCRRILEKAGFSYTYHEGETVTVDFYRNLPTYGYNLIILRVHSATIVNETSEGPFLGLFTSEIFDKANPKYSDDLNARRIAAAFLTNESDKTYFGVTEWFVRDRMIGNFKDTVIIMMGCWGLNDISMAKEFCQRGAGVYISWTGPVTISHTDESTISLLQNLLQRNQTIKNAVQDINPELSKLDYYPKDVEDVGDYNIQHFISDLTIDVDVALILPIFKKPRRHRAKLFHDYLGN